MKRKTTEEYRHELNVVNPDVVLIGEYVGALEHIKVSCRICGNIWNPPAEKLLRGTKCPACFQKNRSIKLSKTDEQFKQELSMVSPNICVLDKYKNKRTKIKCECLMCGKIWKATPDNLLNGRHGCPWCGNKKHSEEVSLTQEEFEDKVNKKFPMIAVTGKYVNYKTKVKFYCIEHDKYWEQTPSSFFKGCGCPVDGFSKGEYEISKYLSSHEVIYIKEFSFNDLYGVNGGLLRYDFYLPNKNKLIEYQGKQHYKAYPVFGGEERFKVQKEHDDRKRKYASDHNIDLLEISYWDFNNIEQILIDNKII